MASILATSQPPVTIGTNGKRSRVLDGIAWLLGISCFIAALFAVGFVFGLPLLRLLSFADEIVWVNRNIFHLSLWEIFVLFQIAVDIGAAGGLALWIATRGQAKLKRTSLAASAVRFSNWGLGLCVLFILGTLAMIGYRWYQFGFM